MIKPNQLALYASAATLALVAAAPAQAGGTTSGTTITNNVTVDYQVDGVAQSATGASSSFKVDRKIALTLIETNTATSQVAPGQTSAVTTFTLTNNSNATLDFALAVAQQTGGAGAHANTDSFDVSNVKIYVDTNGNGAYDVGTDQQVTYLDELGADQSKTVFVVADVPLGQTTGSVAAVTLTATGREGGTANAQGAVLTQTNTGALNEVDPNFVDTVFADAAGVSDAVRDAAHSAKDDYTVLAAQLAVQKFSKVISDPLNNTTNPKAIPGAVIEYCIAVSNAAGSATASGITLSDVVPNEVTYDATFGIKVDGTMTSGVCNADGTAGGSFSGNTVTGPLSNIAAGNAKTLRFRATIN